MAADPSLLAGLDPFELMDAEAGRLDVLFASLPDDGWDKPTACDGWTTKDLLGHLAASEEYNQACTGDEIPAFMERLGARGVTDVASFNAIGVADRSDRPPAAVLAEWREQCGATRQWLRHHRGGEMTTMVGPYPVDWQAVHLANELAIHADDLGVMVPVEEASPRTAWLAAAARFFVSESDKDVSIVPAERGFLVASGGVEEVLDGSQLVAAVNGRLPADAPLDPTLRAALLLMA